MFAYYVFIVAYSRTCLRLCGRKFMYFAGSFVYQRKHHFKRNPLLFQYM